MFGGAGSDRFLFYYRFGGIIIFDGVIVSNVMYMLLFSVAFIALYHFVPNRFKSLLILFGSTVFYCLCDWKYLIILLLTAFWSWIAVKNKPTKAKAIIGCVLPLSSILLLFKYLPAIINSMNSLFDKVGFGCNSSALAILMPIGLSYYIFKEISYVIDVYKGKYPAEKSLIKYASYIMYFPEIISGPISRYNDFSNALNKERFYDSKKFELGFYLIIKGLFMKLVIANRLSGYVNTVFSSPKQYPAIALWLAAFFYAVELYCDFAGYSSIAIGVSQLLGLHYQENFNRPYFACSIKEFWSRWHISLSSWLKDYIYIPLGGNRKGKFRQKANVIIVFLVSGIWHGSGLNFIVWGIYHGVLNILSPKKRPSNKCVAVIEAFINFCLVTFGWIIFRIDSLSTFVQYTIRMFKIDISATAIQNSVLPFTGDNTSVAFLLTAVLFILVLFIREVFEETKKLPGDFVPGYTWQVFLILAIVFFGNFGSASFIYANF